jgi:hypothetical protein
MSLFDSADDAKPVQTTNPYKAVFENNINYMNEGERNKSVSNFVDRISDALNSKDNYGRKRDDDWRYENFYDNENW